MAREFDLSRWLMAYATEAWSNGMARRSDRAATRRVLGGRSDRWGIPDRSADANERKQLRDSVNIQTFIVP